MSNINKVQIDQDIYDIEDSSTIHVYKIAHGSTSAATKAIILEALKRFDSGGRIAFEVSHTYFNAPYKTLCMEIDGGGSYDSQGNPTRYVIGGTYKFAYDFMTSRNNNSFRFGGESITIDVSRDQQTHEITSITSLAYSFLWDGNNDRIPYIYTGSLTGQGGALLSNNTATYTPTENYNPSTKLYTDKTHYENMVGYDSTKTQVLKNVNGTLTWVDES